MYSDLLILINEYAYSAADDITRKQFGLISALLISIKTPDKKANKWAYRKLQSFAHIKYINNLSKRISRARL